MNFHNGEDINLVPCAIIPAIVVTVIWLPNSSDVNKYWSHNVKDKD